MIQVQAPYHFVPLSKWVYMPDWAHLVSHDVPFENGISGIIKYHLTNHTPLCVGHSKDQQNVLRFARNPKGQPIVPGSSLKGMLCNVMDIAAFGKFNQVDDFTLSYRDIASKGGNKSAYLKLLDGTGSQPGWIKYNSDKEVWEFTKCKVAKIHHDEIEKYLDIKICNKDKAIKKYSKLPLTQTVKAIISDPKGVKKNQWAENLGMGNTEGHCVFTNQRILGQGKPESYEFSYFFFAKNDKVTSDQIGEQVKNLFANHRSVEETVNGVKYDQSDYLIKHAHPEHGIPVFALMMQNKVHSFGFARMPRVSYTNSNHDLIKNLSKEHMEDAYFSLTELIFGTLRDKGFGLKSRVQFSDAVMTNKETSMISSPLVLAGPKPSFLGAYIEQPEPEEYHSYGYLDSKETAKVAGWKRYPVRQEFKENPPSNDNLNVQTRLELLSENHTFEGQISFHNLKREELAALVWVLTLNGSSAHFHTLGHGKPLGAGAVQFDLQLNPEQLRANRGVLTNITVHGLVEEFTTHMNEQLKQGKWLETPQLKHLLALSDSYISHENDFLYHELKDFQKIKNAKASIESLSYNGVNLSRTERAPDKMGSLSFGRGRLSALFDSESNHHREMLELAEESETIHERKKQKSEQRAKAQKLADAPPVEKACGELQLIVDGQDAFNSTEQKNAAKQIRNVLKSLKTLAESDELTSEQVKQVLSIAQQITIKPGDVQKLTKWLSQQ
ncbi:TIGR03986 family CRISPR-associated RAMP protein [Thalassotalea ponticola]|uniref:TIGR03986 family type III CRISPR-associated RAMP protein n=1 Tax=Thalassotalea ponticola TaxID=1523392 RepID=UPI0025B4D2CD|nr:TIGR03986 family CRISPR-associated RAMP protein [Thalassotalea ponticola]MDN3651357.1 TIGR03986 family CRISPR-associated RAMP protein [Thalassotalea ponticola]